MAIPVSEGGMVASGIRYQVFKDVAGKYWWRLRAANNYVVGNSAEGYEKKQTAVEMVQWMRNSAGGTSPGYEDLT